VGLEVCFQRGLFSGRIAPCLERRRKNLRQRPVFSSSDPPHLQPPSLVMGCCASKALNTDVVDGEKLACGPDADHMPAKTESSSQSEAAMPAAAVSEAAKPQVATETLVSPPVPAPATELEAASTRDLAAAPPNEATLPATTEAVPPPAATAASTEPASLEATGPAEATDKAVEPPASPMETVVGAIQLAFSPLASLGRSMSSLFSGETVAEASSGGDSGGGGGSGSGGGGEALEATVTRLEALVGVSSGATNDAPPSGTPTPTQLAQLEKLVERLEA
jgi:hypothetical protein